MDNKDMMPLHHACVESGESEAITSLSIMRAGLPRSR